ncbi:carboxylesterase [Fusarium acuminatum]|uniref:Carboxylesterase n=1 Tax=Fusarium acuminatum TaxID=5515 RepID=A0ABZ2WUM6_9HYPO
MDPFTFYHESLQTTLRGLETSGVAQFRGIPYGYIPRRYAEAEKIQHLPKDLDCTEFGPKCPQIYVDVGHLLRIPPHHILPREPEDEFKCANLDVVLPKSDLLSNSKRLPVLVWIHGGSQAVTFGNAASGICDMTVIVSDSIRLGKPIIVVSVQYRLNVFALGNGEGSVNLALRDQALALQWVQENIAGFNGDPTQVTLAGESAGAVYCHAHLVINSPARQFILASGSLFLSPPQPPKSVQALRDAILKQLQAINPSFNLDNAPAKEVVKAIGLSGIQSFFLQWEDRFKDWQIETKAAECIVLSDMEREAAIWQTGVRATSANDILKAFNAAEQYADQLKKIYHIYLDRPSSCQNGALDFINDYKFVLPINRLEKLWNDSQKPIFRYLVDEVNPWQSSSGAHHASDLVLLFGGFDQEFPNSTKSSGQAMRKAWIQFINLEQPWTTSGSDLYYSFGPHGVSKSINKSGLGARRRMTQTEMLGRMDSVLLDKVFAGLAAGKVSLLN